MTPADAKAVIRPARQPDFDRIAELTVAAYVEGGFLSAEDDYIAHLADVAGRAAGAQLLVAEVDGEVAASVAVTQADGPLSEVARPGELEFRMLAVSPEFQGRGLARGIVRHIIAEAESVPGIGAVVLCSLQTMTAAHTLYRSEGFVRDPSRDFDFPLKNTSFPFFIRKV